MTDSAPVSVVDLLAIRARAETPEQFAAWLKTCTDEERVEVAAKMLRASDEANECFVKDHENSVAFFVKRCIELTAQRDSARSIAAALEAELAQRDAAHPQFDSGFAGSLRPMPDPYKARREQGEQS